MFCFKTFIASLSCSIKKYIFFAPRLSASSPIEPLPEKTSTNVASMISNWIVLKKDSNTIDLEERVVVFDGSF